DEDRQLSQPFHALVVESAIRRLKEEEIGPSDVVPRPVMGRAALEALSGAVALAVAVFFAWPLLGRVGESAWIALFPQTVVVEVLPGDVRIVAGEAILSKGREGNGRGAL